MKIRRFDLFINEPITAGETIVSETLKVIDVRPPINGYFSLQYNVTGTGTYRFKFICSNDGQNFFESKGEPPILSEVTNSSGFVACRPSICSHLRVQVEELKNDSGGNITAILVVG